MENFIPFEYGEIKIGDTVYTKHNGITESEVLKSYDEDFKTNIFHRINYKDLYKKIK